MTKLLIFVSYDESPLARLKELLLSYDLKEYFEHVVVADTRINRLIHLNRTLMIVGEHSEPELNSEWEFSGYKLGFDLAKLQIKNSLNYEAFFMNDTLVKHGRLRKCERLALMEYRLYHRNTGPSLVGFFHKTSYLPDANPYANTKFFVINSVKYADVDEAFCLGKIKVKYSNNKYWNNIFQSDSYNSFLKAWLNSKKILPGKNSFTCWYKAEEINETNKEFFEKKARSIIHEHLLTNILQSKNISMQCIVKKSIFIKMYSLFSDFKY